NFIENFVNGSQQGAFTSPLFARPLRLDGRAAGPLTLGVRPEHVRVYPAPRSDAVPARVLSRAIVVGGQQLVALQVADFVLKAKVAADVGRTLTQEAWVHVPLERVTLFGADGHKPGVALQHAVDESLHPTP
ncbi:MAG: ABC transporter ATP-binding protein, partial [Candidatus Thermofonsia Clade 3 bacterium]